MFRRDSSPEAAQAYITSMERKGRAYYTYNASSTLAAQAHNILVYFRRLSVTPGKVHSDDILHHPAQDALDEMLLDGQEVFAKARAESLQEAFPNLRATVAIQKSYRWLGPRDDRGALSDKRQLVTEVFEKSDMDM